MQLRDTVGTDLRRHTGENTASHINLEAKKRPRGDRRCMNRVNSQGSSRCPIGPGLLCLGWGAGRRTSQIASRTLQRRCVQDAPLQSPTQRRGTKGRSSRPLRHGPDDGRRCIDATRPLDWRSNAGKGNLVDSRTPLERHRKDCLFQLLPDTPLKVLGGTRKARWFGEQTHQQLKEAFDLDRFGKRL